MSVPTPKKEDLKLKPVKALPKVDAKPHSKVVESKKSSSQKELAKPTKPALVAKDSKVNKKASKAKEVKKLEVKEKKGKSDKKLVGSKRLASRKDEVKGGKK